MKWALIDFFELDGVDLDFIAKLGRVRDSIKNIFFETKTVSTPGGEKITERLRGFKEISELVQASFNSITLPEISLESFTNKLTAATEAIKYFYEKGLGLFKDSAYNRNFYRLYCLRTFKKYTLDKDGKKIDSVSQTERVAISGNEIPFLRNPYNSYTTKEILFSDETFNGVAARFEIFETLIKSNSNIFKSYVIFLE